MKNMWAILVVVWVALILLLPVVAWRFKGQMGTAPGMVSVEAPNSIRELSTDWANMAQVFVKNPQFGLTFQIDPGVQATVTGRWTKIPMRSILDEVCLRDNLKWEVAGPNIICIGARE